LLIVTVGKVKKNLVLSFASLTIVGAEIFEHIQKREIKEIQNLLK
jgi:hypothetical protein